MEEEMVNIIILGIMVQEEVGGSDIRINGQSYSDRIIVARRRWRRMYF